MKCPFCAGEMVLVGEGQLDQSGDTYLPAEKWACEGEHCAARLVVVWKPSSTQWKPYPPIGEA